MMPTHLQRYFLLIILGAAAVMLGAEPGVAQINQKQPKSNKIDPITGYPIPPNRGLTSNRAPAKVTVNRRSYLDPGKESKSTETFWSIFPGDSPHGLFYDPTDWKVGFHNRDPMPNCLDLPGFCR
jgi:hypothetical protein